jgi:SAM-dependent methyltransferase
MERMRFQGVANVLRFNWHYYTLALLLAAVFFVLYSFLDQLIFAVLGFVLIAQALVSIVVTHLVYDRSRLYEFHWLNEYRIDIADGSTLVNFHAGFDETSETLTNKFPASDFRAFDFFEADAHTERSIKRARVATASAVNATKIKTTEVPVQDSSVDVSFVIFAAHEIRNDAERIAFFKELERTIKSTGRIVVTEHIRDVANLVAYNLGAIHFLPRSTWLNTFAGADLHVANVIKTTPFVTTFVLEKYGTAR